MLEPLEIRELLSVCRWDGGGADNNWTTAANWQGDVAPVAGDDLVFEGTVRTATQNNFTAGTSFQSIEFGANNFSIAGNGLTLTSGITVDSGVTGSAISAGVALSGSVGVSLANTSMTISGVLSGTGSLSETGSGTLILTANNTYSGTTTIGGGTLQVGSGGSSGTLGSGNVTDNSSLVFNRSDSPTVGNAISGTGSLTKQGSGTLILTGANSYGTTTISAGILQVGNYGTAGTLGSGSVVNNAILSFYRTDNTTVANAISGTGSLVQGASSTLVLTGNNSYSGTTSISTGTLQIGAGGTLGTGSVLGGIFSNYGTLVFNRGDALTVANAITGQTHVIQQGTGAVTLSGANTYVGNTTINTGTTLKAGANNLNVSSSGSLTISGTLDLNGYSVNVGGLNGGGAVLSGVAGGATLVAGNNNQNGTFSGVIQNGSGTVALTKVAGGVLTLTGTNTYGGVTTISGGTLQVGNAGTTGTLGSGNVVDNAYLAFNRSGTITVANAISGTGALTQSSNGTLVLTGNNSYSGTTSFPNGTIQVGAGSTSGTLGTGSVVGGFEFFNVTWGTLIFNRSDALTVSNAISSYTNVIQQGSGPVTFTGSNTYTGTTTINAGTTLKVGSSNANVLPNGSGTGSVIVNGTLDLNGYNATVGGLEGGGAILTSAAGTSTLSVGNGGQSTGFGGVIQNGSGTVALTKVGGGTFTLTGTNTYGGVTTISGGFLQVGYNSSTGTLGTGAVVNNAGLNIYRSGTVTIANAISGNGSLTQAGMAGTTVILTGNNTYTGTTSVPYGTLQVGAGGTSGTLGTGTFIGGFEFFSVTYGTLVFNRSDSYTVSCAITSYTNMVQQGAGTTVLTGANSYSGSTTISGGTLQVGNGGTTGTLGTGDVSTNATLAFNRSSALTVGNALSGSGSVTKTGTGVLTLSGYVSFGGTLTVNQGDLRITGSILNSTVTVNSGGTLSGTGSAGVVTVNGGTVTPGSAGVGTLGTKNLSFGATSSLSVDVSTSTADQVNVTGTVNLGGVPLTVTSNRAYQAGSVIVLVKNDGTDAITGTFSGLAEGSILVANSVAYTVSYRYNAEAGQANTGNDVALIATPVYVKIEAADSAAKETPAGDPTDGGQLVVTRYGGVDLSQALTVTYSIGGTATGGSDYTSLSGSVTIPVGATSAPINVSVINDSTKESAETVLLTLTGTGYTIGSPSNATVTIADNDQWQVKIEATDADAAEPFGQTPVNPGQFTVTRSGETDLTYALVVSYTISGTAINGSDYTTIGTSVTIPAGATSATIDITPIADSLNEGDETVVLSLASSSSYTIGTPASATVTMAAENSYDPEFITPASITVPENTTSPLTVQATDADVPAQTVVYSITGGADAAIFSLNASTGVLSFITGPDYETPLDSDSDNVYQVQVKADDQHGRSVTQNIQITVTPLNDNAPVFLSGCAYSVAENQTAVATIQAVDDDEPPQTVIYTITGGADAARFAINSSTGALSFVAGPDYENPTDADANNLYLVDVTADDQNGNTTTRTIQVSIVPVNESAPVFAAGSAQTLTIAEESPYGTVVGSIDASDDDRPPEVLYWSILAGDPDHGFQIDEYNGSLAIVDPSVLDLDYDDGTAQVAVLTVQVSDGLHSVTQEVTVNVSPLNENAPVFTSPSLVNHGGGTTNVLTVEATDADLPPQTLAYSITGGEDAARFTIDEETGELSFLTAPSYANPTDANADGTYLVQVTADDQDGQSTSQRIQINVINARPTVQSAAAAAQDPVTGTSVALSVLGADDGGEANLSYTWTATEISTGEAVAGFSVNGTNAAKDTVFTFAEAGSYRFTVTITDAEGASAVAVTRVIVDPTLSTLVISRSATPPQVLHAGGSEQLTILGYDQFGDLMAELPELTWSATAGTIADGLYVAPDVSATATVTVHSGTVTSNSLSIEDVNQAPTVGTAAAASQSPVTGTSTVLSAVGADDAGGWNLTYTWSVTSLPTGADAPTFATNGTSAAGQTLVTFTSAGAYGFLVTIADEGGLSVTSSVSVTVEQTMTTITVGPDLAEVEVGDTQQFYAAGTDQFGDAMVGPFAFTWSATAGTVDANGLFTAPKTSVPVTVTAQRNGASGNCTVLVTNSSPDTSLRTGDSATFSLWQASLGDPSGLGAGHWAQLTGQADITLSTGYLVSSTDTFELTNQGNYSYSPNATTTTSQSSWTVGELSYAAEETDVLTPTILATLDGEDWTYTETLSLSYTITTTLGGNAFSTTTGSYGYTFEAWGDADTSNYSCTITASATAGGPYLELAGATSGTWTQTTTNTDTITNATNVTTGEASATRSGSGTTTAGRSSSGTYSEGSVSGTFSYEAPDSASYGYSMSSYYSATGGWASSGTAWQHITTSNTYSYSGSGPYSDSGEGWSSSGSESKSGVDHSFSDYTTYYSLSSGAWQFSSGAGDRSGNGESHSSYTGGGSYTWADETSLMNGTFQESGSDHSAYSYSIHGTYSASGWGESGSASVSTSGGSHYSYSGAGMYEDSGDTWSGSGALAESGADDSSYGYTQHYSWTSGNWNGTDGIGSSHGSGNSHSSYMGAGIYSYSGDGQTMDGTYLESGVDHASYDYDIDSSCSGGVWTDTGGDTESASGNASYEYVGDGSYGYWGDDWISAGDLNEDGNDYSSYNSTADYELGSDGEWDLTYSNDHSVGDGETHWSYSGGGIYDYLDGATLISGDFDESGSENTSYDYDTTSTFALDEWSDTGYENNSEDGDSFYSYSGDGTSGSLSGGGTLHTVTESGADESSYSYSTHTTVADGTCTGSGGSSGSGYTQVSYTDEGSYTSEGSSSGMSFSVSGSFEEGKTDDTSYRYTTSATYTDGAWTETGSGSATVGGSTYGSYSASGGYTHGALSGSIGESGHNGASFSRTKDYTLLPTGDWFAYQGSGESSGSSETDWSYSGNGSVSSSGSLPSGSYEERGDANTKFEYRQTASYDPIYGDWTENGSATGSGSGGSFESYSGSGTYVQSSGSAAGFAWSGGAGSTSENRSTTTGYSYSKAYLLDANGDWQIHEGSGSAWGDGTSHSGSSATTAATFSSGGVTGSGTVTNSKTSDVSYHYSEDYSMASDGRWRAGQGSGGASGSGNTHFSGAASGPCSDAGLGWSAAGSLDASARQDLDDHFETSAEATAGIWRETSGSATVTDSGSRDSSYSASGSYSVVTGATAQETGGAHDAYSYSQGFTRQSNGTWLGGSASGNASGSSNNHWSYSASGTYHEDDTNVTGNLQQSGHDDWQSHYNTESVLSSGTWITSGSGDRTNDSGSSYSYSGSGTVTNSGLGISAPTSESGNGGYSSHNTEDWTFNGGSWNRTATAESLSGSYAAVLDTEQIVLGLHFSPTVHSLYDANSQYSRNLTGTSGSGGTWVSVGSDTTTTTSHGTTWLYGGDAVDRFGTSGSGCVAEFSVSYSSDGSMSYSGSTTNTVSGSFSGTGYEYEYGPTSVQYSGYYQDSFRKTDYEDDELRGEDGHGPLNGIYGAGMFSMSYWTWGDGTLQFHGFAPDRGMPTDQHTPATALPGNIATMTSQATWMTGTDAREVGSLDSLAPEHAVEMLGAKSGGYAWAYWDCLTDSPVGLAMLNSQLLGSGELGLNSPESGFGTSEFGRGMRSLEPGSLVERDLQGRPVSLADANGGRTRFAYDAAGNLSRLTDPVGNSTDWGYDEQNRLVLQTDALGNRQSFRYDSLGRLDRFTAADGSVREYAYIPEELTVTETWYPAVENADAGENAENTIRVSFDWAMHITSESDDVSSDLYTYDSSGRMLTATESSNLGPTVVLSYSYEGENVNPSSMAVSIDGVPDFINLYQYDAHGNLVQVIQTGQVGGYVVANKEVDLSYNAAGQIATATRSTDGQLVVEADYSYNSLGQLVGLVYHQGETVLASYAWTWSGAEGTEVSSPASANVPAAWMPNGGLPVIGSVAAGQGMLPVHDTKGVVEALLAGSYSAYASQLTSCTSADGTVSYSYDPAGQLIGASYSGGQADEAYSYDLNGNRTKPGYVTGPDNQLLSDGTYWYTYDQDGNRSSRFVWTDADADGVIDANEESQITEYGWDNRNRLVQITERDSLDGPATQVVREYYDVENRWIGRVVDPDGETGAADLVVTTFAYAGNQIILEFEGIVADQGASGLEETGPSSPLTAADLSHRYLWGQAVDQLLADEQLQVTKNGNAGGHDLAAPGNVVWALTDHLGTVRDLAVHDSATGVTSVANHRVFDAYGNLKSQTNAAVDCLFGFTGRPWDGVTELQNNLERWYDPSIGRWVSEDPIAFNGLDVNAQRYVANDPLLRGDPSGLKVYKEVISTPAYEALYSDGWLVPTYTPPRLHYFYAADDTQAQIIAQGTLVPLSALDQELVAHCCGHTDEETELAIFLTAFYNTEMRLDPTGFCGGFVNDVLSKLPEQFRQGQTALKIGVDWFIQADPNVLTSSLSWLARNIFMLSDTHPGHFAIRVTFRDNYVAYFDDGWTGGWSETHSVFSFMNGKAIPRPKYSVRNPTSVGRNNGIDWPMPGEYR